ncbi:MAG: hypothetical protein ACRDD1_09700 [Planctomycetia bacterium]
MTDDVIEGVRQAREAFAKAHGYDACAMVAALRRMNEPGDWPVAALEPLPPHRDREAALPPNQAPQGTPTAMSVPEKVGVS